MLPELPLEKYENIGNGSLAGASLLVPNNGCMAKYLEIIDLPEIVMLNQNPCFGTYFQDTLVIPNLEAVDFPKTLGELI